MAFHSILIIAAYVAAGAVILIMFFCQDRLIDFEDRQIGRFKEKHPGFFRSGRGAAAQKVGGELLYVPVVPEPFDSSSPDTAA